MTTINTKTLIAELSWTNRFAEKKTNIPVLATVKFEVSGQFMKLTATDLETAGVSFVDVAGTDTWSTCANVAALLKYLAKVEEKSVTLSGDESGLTVKHGDNEVVINSEGIKTESFPEMPSDMEAIGTLQNLDNSIPKVLVAISAEESRFTLNAALLDVKDGTAAMISTDGHRLSHVTVDADLKDGKLLIGKYALSEVNRIAKNEVVQMAANENYVSMRVGNRRILTRKPTGNFPDYERVMPNPENLAPINIETKPFTKLIERALVMADARSHAIRFNVAEDSLKVLTEQSGSSKSKGVLPVKSGDVDWETGLNGEYVLDFLKLAGETTLNVQTGPNGNASAVQFNSDNWKYVCMPMRM